jgi:hypothetical protein
MALTTGKRDGWPYADLHVKPYAQRHVKVYADNHGQRQPTPLADQVQLGPGLAAIDRTCANVVPPRLARTLMLSRQARDQSSRPCSPSRSRISKCNASNTPALAHWFSRRQTVAVSHSPTPWLGAGAKEWTCGP